MPRSTVLFAVTAPTSAYHFLEGQVQYLVKAGLNIAVTACDDGGIGEWARDRGALFHDSRTARNPSPLADAMSFLTALRILQTVKPDVIVYGTPKAALIFGMASLLARIKNRVYLVHGLRYEGFTGFRRTLLLAFEQVIAATSHSVVCVSPSVRAELDSIRWISSRKLLVLGHGSPNGVDKKRFRIPSRDERLAAREQLGVTPGSLLITFVGRLNPDKGLTVLPALADSLADFAQPAKLAIVGPIETDSTSASVRQLENSPSTIMVGETNNVESVYWASDLIILPTRREGLPTVLIEAGACGIPVVASRATGCVDVVVPGHNGLLVAGEDVESWMLAIKKVVGGEPGIYDAHSIRESTLRRFNQEQVWSRWLAFLTTLAQRRPSKI